MKKLSVILLASILSFSLSSCSDDEDEDVAQISLTGGVWKIVDFSIEGERQELDECEQLETFEFNEDNTFVQQQFTLNEETGECEADPALTGTWEVSPSDVGNLNYLLKFDNNADDDILINLGLMSFDYTYEIETSTGIDRYSFIFEK